MAASVIVFELHHESGALLYPSDDSAYAWHDSLYDICVAPRWTNVELDDAAESWAKEVQAILCENGDIHRLYANFADGLSEPADELGENIAKMRQLKAKYDPNEVFPRV